MIQPNLSGGFVLGQIQRPLSAPGETISHRTPRSIGNITLEQGNDVCLSRSAEFLSLPRVQRSFEFNNATVQRCLDPSLDFLIFVISKSSHFSIRQTIRRTWGQKSVYETAFPHLRVKFLFLLDVDLHSQRKVELENVFHEDLVQVSNLPEHYEYVTYREAAMYTFVQQRCRQAKYLLKTDDDIFLNLFLLFADLHYLYQSACNE